MRQTGAGIVWLSNVDLFNNTTGSSGTINTFGNNRFVFNSSNAGTLVAVGGTSEPNGQQ